MATNPITLLQGTTANATDVETKVNPLYTDLDPSNCAATAVTGTGTKFVLQNAPTITGTLTLSGDVQIAATKKLYLDGGGNTYLIESSADVVDAYVGGSSVLTLTTSSVALGSGVDFKVQSGKKLYIDGGGNTYLLESSADVISGYANASLSFSATSTYFAIPATNKLYLDGGGNTYIEEQSADVMRLVCGGTAILAMNSTIVALPSTAYLYFDGGSDTYIRESSANVLDLYSGGFRHFKLDGSSSGEATHYTQLTSGVSGNTASNVIGYRADASNAGAGDAYNISFGISAFAANQFAFLFPNDPTDPTGGGGAATGRVKIKVNGVTRYLAYY